MSTAADITRDARRALRRAEFFAPGAAAGIAEELAKVRRRVRAGDLRRAAEAAATASTLADRLEHAGEALPGGRALSTLAAEARELAAVLRLEARAEVQP